MPFNSDSYYRNKWRREALERLAMAREAKALGGSVLPDDVAFNVRLARSTWRLYLSQKRICEINRERRTWHR